MKRVLVLLSFALTLSGQVAYERLRQAESDPGNWLPYSGNYTAHRYSRLDQITPANAGRLRLAWAYPAGPTGKIETSPPRVGGTMHLTEPGGTGHRVAT